jgi:integral membrane protein (TIGR01906 family)
MRTMPAWLVLICRLVLTVLIPLVLVLTNVRLLMTPLFPAIEYRLPGFPDDRYGFTRADRLHWSEVAIDYLLNSEGIEFLRKLRFPEGIVAPPESCAYYLDGDCNRLYNDRELRHMEDVKVVTHWVLNVWVISTVAVLLAIGLLYYFREMAALRAGLMGGAVVTLVILLGLVTYLLINFNTFFTQFHQVFFEGETWIFLFSDTLIRLFPLPFWEHAFIVVGGGAILEAAIIAVFAWYRLR